MNTMKRILLLAVGALLVSGLTVTETRAQSHGDRLLKMKVTNNDVVINDAFARAYGRAATSAEISQWKQADLTGWELLGKLIEFLKSAAGADELQKTIGRSYPQSFGREPTNKELSFWMSEAKAKGYGYIGLLPAYHEWLKTPEADAERKSLVFRTFFEAYGRLPTVSESNDYRDEIEKNGEDYSDQIEWLLGRMLLPASFFVAGNKYEALTNELHDMIKRAFLTAGKGQPTEAQYAAWTAQVKAQQLTFKKLVALLKQ
jgi:hypothetical protein